MYGASVKYGVISNISKHNVSSGDNLELVNNTTLGVRASLYTVLSVWPTRLKQPVSTMVSDCPSNLMIGCQSSDDPHEPRAGPA